MSTIDKYVKKAKAKQEGDEPSANEIRMTGTSYVGKYITYAATRLLEKESKLDSIILKATGIAVKGAVLVVEILKHRIKNLHQLNEVKSITVVDEYEPLEEGLDHVKIERTLAVLEIHLSRKDGVLDTQAPGYQKPIPENEVEEEDLEGFLQRAEGRGRGGRGGRRRGGRGRGEGRGGRRGERGRGMRGERKAGRLVGRRGGRGGRRGGPRDELRDDEGEDRRVQSRRGDRRAPEGERREGEGERDRGGRRGGYERRGRGERRGDRPYERRPQSRQGERRINQPK